jgi:hypothetical protein
LCQWPPTNRQLLPAGWRENAPAGQQNERKYMLYTIAMILIILWLLGLVTGTVLGGFIHVLLVIAVVVILLRVISGRKPVL